jgi:alpha-tubulin suppressor-like RCC1 family protein
MVSHNISRIESGSLYSIGNNTYGELGVDNVILTFNKIIKLKPFDQPIIKIATGARHSLILLRNGDLYTFGDNSDSQCTGFNHRIPVPTKIAYSFNAPIVDVYSGYNHCMVILANGDMYAWGDSSSGKLTFNEGGLAISKPKQVMTLKGKIPDNVCLGVQMTVISTSISSSSHDSTYDTI